MRSTKFFVAALAATSISVCFAQPVRPVKASVPAKQVNVVVKAPRIALPQGAKTVTELNLNQDSLFAMLKGVIPSFIEGLLGKEVNSPTTKEVLDTVKSVTDSIKAIHFEQFTASNTDSDKLLSYFDSKLPEWDRVFFQAEDKVALYSKNGESFVFIHAKGNGGILLTVAGTLDLPKLAWAVGKCVEGNPEDLGKKMMAIFSDDEDKSDQNVNVKFPPESDQAPPAEEN